MRAVNLSNSLLVVTPPPDTDQVFSEDAVVIRDQLNEILEIALTVPRVSKLLGRLRGQEYDETNEDDDDDEEGYGEGEGAENVRVLATMNPDTTRQGCALSLV